MALITSECVRVLQVRVEVMEARLERFKGFQPPPRPPVVKPKNTPR